MVEAISIPFLSKATDLLADTNTGLSGAKAISALSGYADQWGVTIPHPTYPPDAPNKRTALLANLRSFSPPQQFKIIEELCDHHSFGEYSTTKKERQALKIELYTRFGELRANKEAKELDISLVEETQHWLATYPEPLRLFKLANLKYDSGTFQRNLIDDLRLALELLLKSILSNDRSLENQFSLIGGRLKERGSTPEFTNMFVKLVEYYSKLQNSHVKHDDSLPEQEVEFIFELTASFMKHIVRVAS